MVNKLTSKPLSSDIDHKSNNICYALLKNNFYVIDHEHGKTIYESPQVHEGRIGCIRSKENLLMTGGFDNTVRLFDSRDWSAVHTFQSKQFM